MAHRKSIPTYRFHQKTGRAIITVCNSDHSRRDILLPGPFDSEESRAEYERIFALLRTSRGMIPAEKGKAAGDKPVAELILRIMQEHVSSYYVHPITKQPTTEVLAIKQALRPLKRLFAATPAHDFGPLSLRALRDTMFTESRLTEEEKAEAVKACRPIGYARTTTNKHIGRIKLLFRWATEQELIPTSVLHGLQAVAGLRRGRSGARETEEVKPVPLGIVEETLLHLPPVVKDVLQLLLLTGALAR